MESVASHLLLFCFGVIFGAGVLFQKVNTLQNDVREIKETIQKLPCKGYSCPAGA